MADLSQDELNKLKASLKEQANLQQKLNEDTGYYFKLIKDIKNLHKDIASAKKSLIEQEVKAKKAAEAYNDALTSGVKLTQTQYNKLKKNNIEETAKVKILKQQINAIKETTEEYTKQAKEAQKAGHVIASMKKDIIGITKTVKQSYGSFKQWSGTMNMDKSIRMSATQMGLLTKQTQDFRDSLDYAGQQTASFGVGIGELAKMQADYSEELGRSVMLGQTGLEAMAQMSKATGLGAEGAAKMAADMEQQGISAERTRDFVEQTMNDSSKMGINASKVIKNIQTNIKMLNKYNFKGGIKGLAKMAQTVTKLGVNMDFVSGMADKLFDIEGAVDMSAQLQVMGGAWAKLADPFKLMYMARNDMAGLTEELGKAAEASVHFNKESGAFEISSMEMHKLRKIAEQTGIAYEDLATAGKNAAKFTMIKKQMNFSLGGGKEGKELKEFIESTSKLNDKGEATIEVKGETKLMKSLSSADIGWLKSGIAEKKSLKERAEASQTFDEKITNLIMQMKQYLLPFVNALDKGFRRVVQKLTDTLKNPELMKGIKSFAESAGKYISMVGKFIANNPVTALVGAITGMGLLQAAKWYLNGVALGGGFNAATKGGSFIKTIGSMLGGGLGKSGGGSMMKGLGRAGGLGIGGMAVGALTDATTDPGSTMNIIGNAAADAMTGAAIGSFLGPIGMAIGGVIGGVYGGVSAYNSKPQGQHDAMFGSPIHDGILQKSINNGIGKNLGGDFNKDRGIIQGGKITPIDNKDDLMAMKPNGPVDRAVKGGNTSSSMRVEFGDINFTGEIKLTTSDGKTVNVDMLKDPQFVRNITRLVQVETSKAINGGKVKG